MGTSVKNRTEDEEEKIVKIARNESPWQEKHRSIEEEVMRIEQERTILQ
jgi:hypothetical protein